MKKIREFIVVVFAVVLMLTMVPMNVEAATAKTPAKPTVTSVKQTGKNKITVKFKKAKNAKKYQVAVSLQKNMKKSKTYTVKALKKEIKGLSAGKTYYVRVRGVNGKKYGKWSKIKKIRLKKKETEPAPIPNETEDTQPESTPEPEPGDGHGIPGRITLLEGTNSFIISYTYDSFNSGGSSNIVCIDQVICEDPSLIDSLIPLAPDGTLANKNMLLNADGSVSKRPEKYLKGRTYYTCVRGVNADGVRGPWSNVVSFVYGDNPCESCEHEWELIITDPSRRIGYSRCVACGKKEDERSYTQEEVDNFQSIFNPWKQQAH